MDTGNRAGFALFSLSLSALVLVPVVVGTLLKIKNKSDAKFQKLTCISAPGKVLVAGGYLVLESPNLGLTVSTSSRFYTSVKLQPSGGWRVQSGNHLIMKVHSPQFYSCYVYRYDPSSDKVTALGGKNPFVEKCVALTMAFIKQYAKGEDDLCSRIKTIGGTHFMDITLRADNDFYSQIQEVSCTYCEHPPFHTRTCTLYLTAPSHHPPPPVETTRSTTPFQVLKGPPSLPPLPQR
jgi:hypothetical protein